MAIKAHSVIKNGKTQWYCVLPKRLTGKRERIFRATKAAAESAAQEIMAERGAFGAELAGLSIQERALILRFRGQLGATEIEAALNQAVALKGRAASIPEAVSDYLARLQPGVSAAHYIDAKYRLKNFDRAFPARSLPSLTASEISDYLDTKKGSQPNFFRILRAFFSDLVFRDLISTNPFDRLPPPSNRAQKAFEIYTSEQMRTLLETAVELGELAVARAAVLTGFYGLRESEAQRLDVANIDGHGVIFVEKMKTQNKGMRERYVEPEPNGWAWLQFLGLPESGSVVGLAVKAMSRHRNEVLKACALSWPYNGRRRAFGSYHLAAFENAAVTAEKMGHTDAETTKSKYRAARRKAAALAYFHVFPEWQSLYGLNHDADTCPL